jgi:hypothetical protein
MGQSTQRMKKKSARARGLEHTGFLSADLRQIEEDQLKENSFSGKTKSRDARI